MEEKIGNVEETMKTKIGEMEVIMKSIQRSNEIIAACVSLAGGKSVELTPNYGIGGGNMNLTIKLTTTKV
jgi:hypothetical protein